MIIFEFISKVEISLGANWQKRNHVCEGNHQFRIDIARFFRLYIAIIETNNITSK